jgi:hypothetical protein
MLVELLLKALRHRGSLCPGRKPWLMRLVSRPALLVLVALVMLLVPVFVLVLVKMPMPVLVSVSVLVPSRPANPALRLLLLPRRSSRRPPGR